MERYYFYTSFFSHVLRHLRAVFVFWPLFDISSDKVELTVWIIQFLLNLCIWLCLEAIIREKYVFKIQEYNIEVKLY